MSKKQNLAKSNSPYWNTELVKAMQDYLSSKEGQNNIHKISKSTSETERLVNEMIVINPDQLREPFTI